ncbi:ABC transporter ATP-binding protein, partial [Streptomyces tendae]
LQRAATGLLVWAGQAGVELRRLDVRSASLEEAFLSIAKQVSSRTGEGPALKTTKEYAA